MPTREARAFASSCRCSSTPRRLSLRKQPRSVNGREASRKGFLQAVDISPAQCGIIRASHRYFRNARCCRVQLASDVRGHFRKQRETRERLKTQPKFPSQEGAVCSKSQAQFPALHFFHSHSLGRHHRQHARNLQESLKFFLQLVQIVESDPAALPPKRPHQPHLAGFPQVRRIFRLQGLQDVQHPRRMPRLAERLENIQRRPGLILGRPQRPSEQANQQEREEDQKYYGKAHWLRSWTCSSWMS